MQSRPLIHSATRVVPACLLAFGLCLACGTKRERRRPTPAEAIAHTLHESTAHTLHESTVERPSSTGKLRIAAKEASGAMVGIACKTCHGGGAQSLVSRSGLNSGDFHKQVEIRHAELTCVSCHVLETPQLLHLSDGTRLPIVASMQLCTQCHGPKRRAYDHGAHGGMRGYWNLSSGPRKRNDCVTCHAAHQPAYPRVRPAPGPKDRGAHRRRHVESVIESRYGASAHE